MSVVPSVSPDNGTAPSTSGANGRTHLTDLADTVGYAKLIERMQLTAVRGARAEGRTWEEIGDALGVTHQAARQRWSRKCKDLEQVSTA